MFAFALKMNVLTTMVTTAIGICQCVCQCRRKKETFHNAISFCKQQTARLVHVDSQEKQQFIEAFIKSFIGILFL